LTIPCQRGAKWTITSIIYLKIFFYQIEWEFEIARGRTPVDSHALYQFRGCYLLTYNGSEYSLNQVSQWFIDYRCADPYTIFLLFSCQCAAWKSWASVLFPAVKQRTNLPSSGEQHEAISGIYFSNKQVTEILQSCLNYNLTISKGTLNMISSYVFFGLKCYL
jgi:hypothetical protein